MRSRDVWAMQKDPVVEKLDFTKLTRYSKNFITSISVKQPYGRSQEWITCGAISIQKHDKIGYWTVRCRMERETLNMTPHLYFAWI